MKYWTTVLLTCLLATSAHATTLDDTRANLHSAYDSLMQSLSEQEKLGNDIARLNDEIAKQRKALEPDTQRVAELRAKVNDAQAAQGIEASSKTDADLQTAQMRLKVAEIEYRGLSENLTQQEKALADAVSRMKTLESGTQAQIQKVQKLRQEVATLATQEQATDAKREASRNAETEKLKGELITLKVNLQEAQANNDVLSVRANALQAEVDALKSRPCDTAAGIPHATASAVPATAVAAAATTRPANNTAEAKRSTATPKPTAAPAVNSNAVAAELAARLASRNMDKAVSKSGRYLYVKTITADGQTHSQTYPWLTVDRNYYTLEANMKAGEVTLTFGNQRETISVPASDDGATYVFVLSDASKDDAKIAYFKKTD